MQQYYTLHVAGLTRELPICSVSDTAGHRRVCYVF